MMAASGGDSKRIGAQVSSLYNIRICNAKLEETCAAKRKPTLLPREIID